MPDPRVVVQDVDGPVFGEDRLGQSLDLGGVGDVQRVRDGAPPAAAISAVTLCAASPFRSATWTRAPRWASRSAVERPIPDPAPVTTATLPARLISSLIDGDSLALDEGRGTSPEAA